MNLEDFLVHAKTEIAPETIWSTALQAIWYAEKGDWDIAHELCQKGDTPNGAWVHANLHRQEGDISNAGYWYSRAGKPAVSGDVTEERHQIIANLLVHQYEEEE